MMVAQVSTLGKTVDGPKGRRNHSKKELKQPHLKRASALSAHGLPNRSTHSSTEEKSRREGQGTVTKRLKKAGEKSKSTEASVRSKAESARADGWMAFVEAAGRNHPKGETNCQATYNSLRRVTKQSKMDDEKSAKGSREIGKGKRDDSQSEPVFDEEDGESSDDEEEATRQSQHSATSSFGVSAGRGQKRSKEEMRKARAERKRCREKERRSNVNKGYGDLTDLLQKIEAAETESNEKKDEEKGPVLPFEAPQNRVDLIARTVQVMERLFQENRELKQRFSRDASIANYKDEAKSEVKAPDNVPVTSGSPSHHSSTEDNASSQGNATIFVPVMVPWDDQIPQRSFNLDNSIPVGHLPPSSIFPAAHEHGHRLLREYLNPGVSAARRLLAAESAAHARAFDTLRFPTPATSRTAALEAAAILADVAARQSTQHSYPYQTHGPRFHPSLHNTTQRTGGVPDTSGLYDPALAEIASYRRLGPRDQQAIARSQHAESGAHAQSEATSARGTSHDANK